MFCREMLHNVRLAIFSVVIFAHSLMFVRSSNFSVKFPTNVELIAVGGRTNDNGYQDNVDILTLSSNTHRNASPLPITAKQFGNTMINSTIFVIEGFVPVLSDRNFFAYDIAANVWTNLRDFPYDASGNAAVAVNGSIFSLGGYSAGYGYMNYTFEYDTRMRIWWRIPALLPATQFNPCVVADQSSMYLIADSGDLFRSDDGAHTWKKLSSMLRPRSLLTCVMLPNGSIMVAGGYGNRTSINSVDLYNIAENAWTSKTPMTRARHAAQAVVIPESDYVVVCGGYNTQDKITYDDCELFSMAENQWGFTDFKLNMPRRNFGLFVSQGQK